MNTIIAAASMLAASDLSGTYAVEGVREMASAFRLHKDQSFEFYLIYGAADYSSKGTWKADGDSIVLTTPGTQSAPFRLLKSSRTPEKEAVRIRLVGEDGRTPVPNIDVYTIDGKEEVHSARTDSQGIAYFDPSVPVKSCVFEIRVYQYQSDPMSLPAGDDDFTFQINGKEIMQVRFDNERVRLTETGFELRHFNPDHPMHYRRVQD